MVPLWDQAVVHKPYDKAENEEKILAMNSDRYNPTAFADVKLLGVQRAMGWGWTDAITW